MSLAMSDIIEDLKEVVENLLMQMAIYMPAFHLGHSMFEIVGGIIDCSIRTIHFKHSKTGDKELIKEIITFSSIWFEVLAKVGLSARSTESYGEIIYNEI